MRDPGRFVSTLFLPLLTLASTAFAQTVPSLNLRTWRPSSSPEASLVLETTATPGAWQWNVGAWLEYGQSPVVLRSAAGAVESRPLAHVLGADLVAGIGLGDRAAVGFDLPVFVWQDGTTALPPAVVSGGAVSTTGLGDVTIHGKATVLSNDRQGIRGGLGIAALGAIALPTGDRRSFAGDGTPSVSLVVLGEYALGVGAVRAALGYKLRADHRRWPDSTPDGVSFGDEIPWSIALSLRPKAVSPALDSDDRQTWEIGLHGSLPAGPVTPFGLGDSGASSLSPVLVAADDRIALGHYRDAYVLAGVEVGLDRAFGTPDFRGVVSLGWAPRSHDRDHDGVPDDVDECPDLPEDRDGIQDGDGCPEDDADGDGIPDAEDACPLVPGVAHDDRRTNGCPEKK